MTRLLCLGTATAVIGLALAAMGLAESAASGPPGTFAGCPRGLQPLPSEWRAGARTAAIHFLHTTYARWNRERHWRIRLRGAQAGQPFLVRRWLPSGWVKSECRPGVWQRSVGVSFWFPAMEYPNPKGPCNACAHVTLLLGEIRHGWLVWGNY